MSLSACFTDAKWRRCRSGTRNLQKVHPEATLEQQLTSNSHVSPLSLLLWGARKAPRFFCLYPFSLSNL